MDNTPGARLLSPAPGKHLMPHLPFWSLVAALALLVAACSGDGSEGPQPPPPQRTEDGAAARGDIVIPPGRAIEIGVSVPLTGEQAALGADIADAADLAIGAFGRPIGGHAIAAVRRDDGCADAEMAVAAARAFIEAAAVAGVIGPLCTTGAQAANDEYAEAGVVHISPSVTRSELSEVGDPYFFRVVWRDDAQALVQARFARGSLSATTAVVIDDGEPYGTGLAGEFADAFAEAGGRVLSRERIDRGTTDFSSIVRQVVSAAPDIVVYEGLNPEAALLVRALRGERFTGAFMAPDGVLNVRDFVLTTGDAAEGAILSGGAIPDEAFVVRFGEKYGRIPATPFVLQAHDAVTVLLEAIDDVARVESDGSLRIVRAELAAALRANTQSGLLTGDIAFDERGDRAGDTARALGLRVYRVTGGVFVPVD